MVAPFVASEPRTYVFTRLWGIALVAHVVGNAALADLPSAVGWTNLAVGITGIFLVLRPSTWVLLLASVLVPVSVLLETPILGNHWLLAGLSSAAILLGRGESARYEPTLRVVLIVFYAFAAFAKFNDGFFDPSVSCAVFYSNQWLAGFGLPPIDSTSPAASLAIWASALIEVAVAVSLLVRPLRVFGVVLGTLFHTVISFDLNQHFYDFTAILLPLFFLFLPAALTAHISSAWKRLAARTRIASGLFSGVGALLVVAAVSPPIELTRVLLRLVPFAVWIPFSLWWLVLVARAIARGERLAWAMGPTAMLLVLFTFLNGLSPYLELKTAFSFNMYSNLLTANGESNHFVIRRTWPLREGYQRPVRVIESSDPALMEYARRDYLIAYPEFRRYLSRRPDISVTYQRDGSLITVTPLQGQPVIADGTEWWRRFAPLRSIDAQRPPRCQPVFLPAL